MTTQDGVPGCADVRVKITGHTDRGSNTYSSIISIEILTPHAAEYFLYLKMSHDDVAVKDVRAITIFVMLFISPWEFPFPA